MSPILKNVLALVLGLFIGGSVNMSIVLLSETIIAPPEGADLTTMEGIIEAMPTMSPKHFIMPFLAHALGTLAGAFAAAKAAATHQLRFALAVGGFFMIGGIMMVVQLPSPMWFNVMDIGLAYIPMAFIGAKLAGTKK